MKKSVLAVSILGLIAVMNMAGCGQSVQNVPASTETKREEQVEASQTEDENDVATQVNNEDSEQPDAEIAENSEEENKKTDSMDDSLNNDYSDVTDSDNSSDDSNDYTMLKFDVLGVELPCPKWVGDWGKIEVTQRYGSCYCDSGEGESFALDAFLAGDGISLETGEPVVYDENFFDDTDPEDILEWSDEDNFFKIHALVRGFDTFMCIYHMPEYNMSCKMTCKSDDAMKYEKAFDYICKAIKEAEPQMNVISERDIVEYVQKIYKSPIAAVDHYENGYMPVVHLYEVVENPEESHTATWGWVMVDPVTGEAVDEITYESFVVPGAKVHIEQ